MITKHRKRIVCIVVTAIIIVVSAFVANSSQQEQKNARLVFALKHNDTGNVLSLLARGADANARDAPADARTFWRQIIDAMHGGQPSVKATCALIVALQYGLDKDDPPDNVEEVQALLDHGARIDVRDSYGFTPLMIAGASGKLETAHLLVDRGADINAENDGVTVLMGATLWDREKVCKFLLEDEAAVNTQDFDGRTALMRAISGQDYDIVKLLLSRKPDVNLRAHNGETALSIAKHKLREAVPLLKRFGAVE